MNPREKKIFAVVILVVLIAGGLKGYDYIAAKTGSVSLGAKNDFQNYYDDLRVGPIVRAKYAQLNTKLPTVAPGRTPELTFTDEVTRMLNARGWTSPQVEPARTTAIKEVNDYYYIDLLVKVAGPVGDLMNLLADFQDQNIMIKQFKLEKANMDQDQVALEVTVARLAKFEPEDSKKKRRSKR